MRPARILCAAALGFTLMMSGTPLQAQSAADKAAAEALFDQGRAAMQDGDFAKACGLLDRSQRIDPGVGTLLYLAECYEKSGRTASAWATFREGADAADARKDTSRARMARERAARLEPQLSRLTVQVSPEAQQIQGLSIDRGGQAVASATWNVPLPVDPGDYAVTASASGYEPWSQSVTVGDRAARASITVPALKKLPETAAPVAAAVPESQPTMAPLPTSPIDTSPERPGSSQRTTAFILGGAGLVGVGVGSYFGLRAISKNNDAKAACPSFDCGSQPGVDASDDAHSAARAANIAFALGGAALVAGAVLYITAPDRPRSAAGVAIRARVAPTAIGLEGSFQ